MPGRRRAITILPATTVTLRTAFPGVRLAEARPGLRPQLCAEQAPGSPPPAGLYSCSHLSRSPRPKQLDPIAVLVDNDGVCADFLDRSAPAPPRDRAANKVSCYFPPRC